MKKGRCVFRDKSNSLGAGLGGEAVYNPPILVDDVGSSSTERDIGMLVQEVELFGEAVRFCNIIGIHPCDEGPSCYGKAHIQCSGELLFRGVFDEPHACVGFGEVPEDLLGPVTGVIEYENQLEIPKGLGKNAVDCRGKVFSGPIDGDDYADRGYAVHVGYALEEMMGADRCVRPWVLALSCLAVSMRV